MKRGFTLIELLVVISIIGLLSSITLVNINSARKKARIAAGLRFASSLQHALGSFVGPQFSMEHEPFSYGGQLRLPNESEPDNFATLGTSSVINDPDFCVVGNSCLGITNGELILSFGQTESLDDLWHKGGAVMMWVYPTDLSSVGPLVLMQKGDYWSFDSGYFILNEIDERLSFKIHFDSGTVTWTTQEAGLLSEGAWQHVAVLYNRDTPDKDPQIYVNGELRPVTQTGSVGAGTYTPDTASASFGGTTTGTSLNLPGYLDDIRVFQSLEALQ